MLSECSCHHLINQKLSIIKSNRVQGVVSIISILTILRTLMHRLSEKMDPKRNIYQLTRSQKSLLKAISLAFLSQLSDSKIHEICVDFGNASHTAEWKSSLYPAMICKSYHICSFFFFWNSFPVYFLTLIEVALGMTFSWCGERAMTWHKVAILECNLHPCLLAWVKPGNHITQQKGQWKDIELHRKNLSNNSQRKM